jgi:hypothetical protein
VFRLCPISCPVPQRADLGQDLRAICCSKRQTLLDLCELKCRGQLSGAGVQTPQAREAIGVLRVVAQQVFKALPRAVHIRKTFLEHGRESEEEALSFGIRVRDGRDATLVYACELLPCLDEEEVLLQGAEGGRVAGVDGKLLEQPLNAHVVHGRRRVGLHD